jgi:hypothetical protein
MNVAQYAYLHTLVNLDAGQLLSLDRLDARSTVRLRREHTMPCNPM